MKVVDKQAGEYFTKYLILTDFEPVYNNYKIKY